MRFFALACLLLTAAFLAPAVTAKGPSPDPSLPEEDLVCKPQPGTYILPAGFESRGGSVWEFTGVPDAENGGFVGTWIPVVCTS